MEDLLIIREGEIIKISSQYFEFTFKFDDNDIYKFKKMRNREFYDDTFYFKIKNNEVLSYNFYNVNVEHEYYNINNNESHIKFTINGTENINKFLDKVIELMEI